jgi:hypothetical protein
MARHIWLTLSAATITAALLASPTSYAQVATTLEQAEMAGLNPEKKAEVERRLKQGGQTVYEILQTILLNSLQVKFPASRIDALDFNKGIATITTADGKKEEVNFDPTTLSIKS